LLAKVGGCSYERFRTVSVAGFCSPRALRRTEQLGRRRQRRSFRGSVLCNRDCAFGGLPGSVEVNVIAAPVPHLQRQLFLDLLQRAQQLVADGRPPQLQHRLVRERLHGAARS